ncbi:oligosaccharide flippase family protein [Planotetraspora kaengkrachanensis]|uniref:Polysaccharide biosynthesis protein n=1 Tax=Planotetraspora kaengkrachanensis TaxID=575193 RepID=A0A8J3M8D5_9ACTN|nr:polysaccharide biosynthesis C-terminal domain-containing protein [Planotetraspora kaengkrachanensis]GIG79635.1 polysaccharide biosynthesis protein [Planotetraspora kaengkrachanensis]
MLRGSNVNSSLSKVAQTMASRVLRLLLATVTGVLLARTLQPEGRGTYAIIATAAATAIVMGHFSIEQTQISLWADQARRHCLAVNGLFLGLILGIVTALVGMMLTLLGAMPTTSPLLYLALLAVPFGVMTTNLRGIALLRSEVGVVNRATVAAGLIQCLPLLVLIAIGNVTVASVVVCWTISITVPSLILIRALRLRPLRGGGRLACRQLALGSRYHVGVVAFNLLLTVDILLLHALDSAAAVGIYTVAVTVLELARIPAEAITQVALPQQASSDMNDAAQVTARIIRLSLLLSAAFIGVLAALSPTVIPLLYGQSYAGCVAPLLVLAPGMIALFLTRPVEQYLVRLGRPISMTAIPVGAAAANILLNLALIPRWGVVGAALSSTITYVLMAALEISWFARSAGIPKSALLPRPATMRSALDPYVRSESIS